MKNKTHTVTLRLNELEYEYLQELITTRTETDENEYTQSDILRLALHYMIDIEIWGSKEAVFNPKRSKEQQEYAKIYWENKRNKEE